MFVKNFSSPEKSTPRNGLPRDTRATIQYGRLLRADLDHPGAWIDDSGFGGSVDGLV